MKYIFFMTILVLIGLGLNDASPVPKDDADDDQIGIDSLDEIHDNKNNHILKRETQDNNPIRAIVDFCSQCILYKMLDHSICQSCIVFLEEIDINRIKPKNANNYWFSRAG